MSIAPFRVKVSSDTDRRWGRGGLHSGPDVSLCVGGSVVVVIHDSQTDRPEVVGGFGDMRKESSPLPVPGSRSGPVRSLPDRTGHRGRLGTDEFPGVTKGHRSRPERVLRLTSVGSADRRRLRSSHESHHPPGDSRPISPSPPSFRDRETRTVQVTPGKPRLRSGTTWSDSVSVGRPRNTPYRVCDDPFLLPLPWFVGVGSGTRF